MTQRTLVTGGAGFLGSHLCQRLVDRGEHVICLDNLFTGRKETIEHLLKRDNFEFILHDITSPIEMKVDMIYNLACPAAPGHYQFNPIKTLKTNLLGAMHTLGMAKANNAKIFHASTSEVYGDPEVHPQVEGYWGNVNPIGPRSVYDEAKRFSEALAMAFARYKGCQVRIARIFNTYGPRMRSNDGRVIPAFVTQALAGEALTVFGEGAQTRSFCFVSDLIEGFIRLIESDYQLPVNLGNPIERSVLDLATRINSLVGNAAGVIHKPMPIDDPSRRRPDISLAKAELGWEPAVSFEDGLATTIRWFEAN